MSPGSGARTRASVSPASAGRRLLWPSLLLAALAGALVATVTVLLVRGEDERPAARPASPTPPGPGVRVVGRPIRVGEDPIGLDVGPAYVWVVSGAEGAAHVIDPNTDTALDRQVPIGGRPADVEISGSVWVPKVDADTLVRVSPLSNRVTRAIPVGDSPTAVTTSPGAVWVANQDDDTVVRIDSRTSDIVGRAIKVGQAPGSLVYTHGAVWVSNVEDDTVSRIDVRSRRVVETIRVGDQPYGLTHGANAVWVANLEDDTVSRIDPSSNRVVRTIRVGDRPLHLDADVDTNLIWVPNSGDGTLSAIDPNRNRVIGRSLKLAGGVDRVAAGLGAVWALSSADGTVSRIELTN